ncbi:hypothetical protein NDU88_007903 [Pleurodeles waltl]|uniref:Uncharacterized protein n=1 Tax=Pleurodeles waltl TaxID=8319 RepID=A0AAV7N869_PLEWA|nr:hypothetical protein NDU88_007903 [Pleurodeles waltl]
MSRTCWPMLQSRAWGEIRVSGCQRPAIGWPGCRAPPPSHTHSRASTGGRLITQSAIPGAGMERRPPPAAAWWRCERVFVTCDPHARRRGMVTG